MSPTVSILIPIHNCLELTAACLQSIRECTSLENVEVILIDDASDSATAAALKQEVEAFEALNCPASIIRNEERQSFSANNNAAAREAKGTFLCLLNNDTIVTPGWLEGLLDVMERRSDIAVLGNKHLFPATGLLHHCGIGLDSDGHPIHLHPHADPDLPAANYERDLQMVSFACVLIKADIYQKLRGLDERYRNGYEDCDFCLRAVRNGYKVAYTPASIIYHYGQSTPGRTDTDSANWQLFRNQWPAEGIRDLVSVTESDAAFNELIRTTPRRIGRSQAGIHFAVDLSAGSALSWLAADFAVGLAELGQPVSIPRCKLTDTLEPKKRERLESLMTETPNGTYHLKINHYWKNFLQQDLWGEVNAEFFVTNYRFRGDTKPLDPWSAHTLLNEHRKLPMSGFCLDSLRDIGVAEERCRVAALGYAHEIDSLSLERSEKRGEDLQILLTTNSHDLYRYGTDLAIASLAAAYTKNDPVVVHIKDYGAGAGEGLLRRWIAQHPNFPRVVWHERFVTKAELLSLYASMDLALAPYRGEGFSMKILDAMALGLPVMMPAFGGPLEYATAGTFISTPFTEVPVGECYDTKNSFVGPGAYWCEVDGGALTSQLKSLIDDRAALEAVGSKARAAVRGRFSWESASRNLLNILRGWSAERSRSVAANLAPSHLPISVIIPTHNREEILERTLEGYQRQTLDPAEFEIILVNDHGKKERLTRIVDENRARLQLSYFENDGANGPGAARNLAIRKARGEIIFITGDDIIPDRNLLGLHLNGHRSRPELESGFVGLNLWHEELEHTWLMRHIIGAGGQQFNYHGMVDQKPVPFDRFYTSNVSVKRRFLAELENLFNPWFRLAAFEDIELAYRLHLRGLQLHYLENAIGYHHHQMTAAAMAERQRKCGRMLTIMAQMHPKFVPQSHQRYLDALQSRVREGSVSGMESWNSVAEFFLKRFESVERLICSTEAESKGPTTYLQAERVRNEEQLRAVRAVLFDGLLDLMLRVGMAEEWAAQSSAESWAADWIANLALPEVFRTSLAIRPAPDFSEHASSKNLLNDMRDTELQLRLQSQKLEVVQNELCGLQNWVTQFSISGRMKHKLKSVGQKFIPFIQ